MYNFAKTIFLVIFRLSQAKEVRFREVKMSSKQSLAKLSLMIRLLSKAHSFLITGTSATKRELYYQFLLNNQGQLDQCVVAVSSILNAAPWELGILSTRGWRLDHHVLGGQADFVQNWCLAFKNNNCKNYLAYIINALCTIAGIAIPRVMFIYGCRPDIAGTLRTDRGKRRNFPKTPRPKRSEAIAAINFINFNHCEYLFYSYLMK
jgi:Type IIB DNA topoisomerase